ncbi:MAG TPA: hypothetical protein VGV14_01905 [Rhodanobacter sp.]|nr:hypothetical protein [Rhodanobacter sp.]
MKIGIFLITAIMATCAAQAQQNRSGEEGRDASGAQPSAVISTGSESPYSFKKAYLGMTLEEFKRVTSGDLVERGTGHNILGMPTTKKFPTPFCTDSIREFEGDPMLELKPGEIVCNPSPQDANQDLLAVTGLKLRRITYSFFHEKLYKISLTIAPSMFGKVFDAFSKKYGAPHRLDSDEYQNDFGAVRRGENFRWGRGAQSITLNQGSGEVISDSEGVFIDSSLGPPAAPQHTLDF